LQSLNPGKNRGETVDSDMRNDELTQPVGLERVVQLPRHVILILMLIDAIEEGDQALGIGQRGIVCPFSLQAKTLMVGALEDLAVPEGVLIEGSVMIVIGKDGAHMQGQGQRLTIGRQRPRGQTGQIVVQSDADGVANSHMPVRRFLLTEGDLQVGAAPRSLPAHLLS
jgi:hypothetical protein